MANYLMKRIGIGIAALFILVTVTFFLTRLMPGSPFQTGNVSKQVLASLEAEYGLDQPMWKQYGIYLANLFTGGLGVSFQRPGVSVVTVILNAWPATACVAVPAVLLALLSGTLLGIWQAVSKHKIVKRCIFFGTILGTAIPNFVIALLLMLILGVELQLFPIAGLATPAHYVLPVISLSVYPAAVVTRLTKNAYAEELKKDYVLLARAKQLKPLRILYRHILPNAWIPALNYLGPAAAFLLTGSFAVENIFTIPGLGREFVLSVVNRDYTMIMGLTVFMGTVVILFTLLTDLLCTILNPQSRKGG